MRVYARNYSMPAVYDGSGNKKTKEEAQAQEIGERI